MSVLQIEHAVKTFHMGDEDIKAVNDVSFTIEKGEFVAFEGQSGSGKTTLMNLVGCLDVPTSGRILINGIDTSMLTDNQLADLRGREIGFIFQSFFLLPHLSALENVASPLMYQNIHKKERTERAKELLSLVGLDKRMSHKPNELSGGQKQRVAIARALISNPVLLLADEPTGALDSKTGEQIMELFTMLSDKGKTIVFVTHDRNLASRCPRNIKLHDGRQVI